ncbi:AimR family lysis-lysogeny pheromone receptor [Priestia koreensis]|uniref:AimR family lysis-lysogeny pheromone receptor n=1 Tax=Priestia koreensis TaxID=284581 RepID=UPI003D026DF5
MREILKKEILHKGYQRKEIAESIGTTSSTITKFLDGTQEVSIDTVLQFIRYVMPQNEKRMMIYFCLEAEKPANLSAAMEYCSTNRLMKTLDKLIDKAKESSNIELKQLAAFYETLFRWQHGIYNLDIQEELIALRKLKTDSEECKIFSKLLEVCMYYYKTQYTVVKDLATDLINDLDQLKSTYLQKSYKARLNEIMSYIFLKLNNLKLAREYAQKVIKAKIGTAFNAFAYFVIGSSYMFSDYDKALHYLEKSHKLYSKYSPHNAEDILNKIEFTNAYWNVHNINYTNELILHYYKKKNNHHDIPQLEVPTNDSFQLFLIGSINADRTLLIKSFTNFIHKNDIFNATLVKEELSQLDENSYLLEQMLLV